MTLLDYDKICSTFKSNFVKFNFGEVGHRNYVIGGRSSHISKPNIFDVLHEVAHLIQLSDEEIITHYTDNNGFLLFTVPKQELNGVYYNDPQTDQISMRELETFCIQYYLEMGLFEKDLSFLEWIEINEIESLFTWMPDDINFGYRIKDEQINIKAQDFLSKWDLNKSLQRWEHFNERIDNVH